MGKAGEQITVILIAIIGVATLAVLVSKSANTSQVIQASAGGFSQALATALSPITGGGMGSFGGL